MLNGQENHNIIKDNLTIYLIKLEHVNYNLKG